ncbi:MAG: GtrA family protein [Bdellovibrionota bacterium]
MSVFDGIVKRLGRSAIVGGLATGTCIGALAIMVQFFGFSPQKANAPSLATAVLVQFFGNRHYVFKALHREALKQMIPFMLVEAAAFLLNVTFFDFVVKNTSIHYTLVRLAGTFLVFISFSFPLWHWVFRKPTLSAETS